MEEEQLELEQQQLQPWQQQQQPRQPQQSWLPEHSEEEIYTEENLRGLSLEAAVAVAEEEQRVLAGGEGSDEEPAAVAEPVSMDLRAFSRRPS